MSTSSCRNRVLSPTGYFPKKESNQSSLKAFPLKNSPVAGMKSCSLCPAHPPRYILRLPRSPAPATQNRICAFVLECLVRLHRFAPHRCLLLARSAATTDRFGDRWSAGRQAKCIEQNQTAKFSHLGDGDHADAIHEPPCKREVRNRWGFGDVLPTLPSRAK